MDRISLITKHDDYSTWEINEMSFEVEREKAWTSKVSHTNQSCADSNLLSVFIQVSVLNMWKRVQKDVREKSISNNFLIFFHVETRNLSTVFYSILHFVR